VSNTVSNVSGTRDADTSTSIASASVRSGDAKAMRAECVEAVALDPQVGVG
jgi:hypothetical protein